MSFKRIALTLIIFTFVAFPLRGICLEADSIELHFLNVGEGDATLLRLPDDQAVLIDAGNAVSGVRIVNYLKQQKVNKLKHVILTHPHLDHIGGIFTIGESLELDKVSDNGEELASISKSQKIFRWYVDYIRSRPNYSALARGDKLNFGRASLKVLWPPKAHTSEDWNTNSLVLMLTFGKFRCLLMGDANEVTERALIAGGEDLEARCLRAGHHGAGDTALSPFLKRVRPHSVVISAPAKSVYGYPSKQVLERYKKHAAKVFRTDLDGHIVVTADSGGAFTLKRERSQ